jgi:hypothetical protein
MGGAGLGAYARFFIIHFQRMRASVGHPALKLLVFLAISKRASFQVLQFITASVITLSYLCSSTLP